MTSDTSPTFRGRRPRALAFGTSGLRGLVTDLTDLEAWINVRGFLRWLETSRNWTPGDVAVAGDLRPSTERILGAVRRAIIDAGGRVRDQGRIPTPALALHGITEGWPSVMVTGSHIPFDRNGIKLNRPDGEVLKTDEAGILRSVTEVRASIYAEAPETSIFDDEGALKASARLEPDPHEEEARARFRDRLVGAFSPGALSGLRIGVFSHSAVGRDLLREILDALGAETAELGRSETFVPVDTEAVDPQLLRRIEAEAEPYRARQQRFDAVVSTDGDSDRPLLVLLDEEGRAQQIRGDTLGAMVAEDLEADAIAVPVSASDLVDRHLGHFGVHIVRTRIGSPYVIAAFPELEGLRNVGFEANGGFLVATPLDIGRAPIDPLPTRDAFLPLVTVLARCAARHEPIAERVSRLPARITAAGLLDEVPPERGHRVTRRLSFRDFEEVWLELPRGRRPGETPRSLSNQDLAAAEAHAAEVAALWASLGVGRLIHLNATDGVRMRFETDDVIHLRPSGNAPQFRIYVTAHSRERAERLVEEGLAAGGPVRRLLDGD